MKGKFKGPVSIEDFYQALYQDREFFAEHNIKFIKSATLYFTPCDEMGETVEVLTTTGEAVEGFHSAGAYKSIADQYDRVACIEPTTVIKPRAKTFNTPPSSGL